MKKEMKMYATPEVETCEILLKTGICSGAGANVGGGGMPGGSNDPTDDPECAPVRGTLIRLH